MGAMVAVRVTTLPARGADDASDVRSRTVVPDLGMFVARDAVVLDGAVSEFDDFCRVDVTVAVAESRRVAARAMSDASSAAAWNASGASNTAKSSLIPFILVYWMLANL